MRALKCLRNIEIIRKKHEMAVAKQQSEAWRKALDGYENGGLLVNYMIDNPYSILLFDEIEKADSKVLDIFLQILDYGILTSTKGEIVDFSNTIIIFTSNLSNNHTKLKKTMGFISNYVLEEDDSENNVNIYLRPEFRGRIDHIISFNELSQNMIKLIIDKNITELKNKLSSYNINIQLSTILKDHIVSIFLHNNLGARSIEKFFRDNINILISNEIINNNIKNCSLLTICMIEDTKVIYIKNITKKNEKLESDSISFELNNNQWFNNAIEAQEFAKNNPMISITRSPCGNGYIVKK
jgi:ATP-dependent Clp protease ATP-binding subunit ClpA